MVTAEPSSYRDPASSLLGFAGTLGEMLTVNSLFLMLLLEFASLPHEILRTPWLTDGDFWPHAGQQVLTRQKAVTSGLVSVG